MNIDLINLPESVKSSLLDECTKKLDAAQKKKPELLLQIAQIDDEITGYSSIVKALTTPAPESANTIANQVQRTTIPQEITSDGKSTKYDGAYQDSEPYSAQWTHAQKIKYVVDRPEKYNVNTLKGSGGIVDAILVEQPEWINEMSDSVTGKRGTLIAKLAPIISRMVDVDNKQLIKLRAKGTKNEFHFVSVDWFINRDEARVKPEYADRIANLELAPSEKKLAPAGSGANNAKSDSDVGGKPSEDAAVKLNGHSSGQLSLSNSH